MDPDNEYVPVRLGDVNAQTRWVLDRAGVGEPRLLPHVLLRVARRHAGATSTAPTSSEPVRDVGLMMAREELDLVPIVDDDGELAGVMTERVLARRYIRESRQTSSLVDAPTSMRGDRPGARRRGARRRGPRRRRPRVGPRDGGRPGATGISDGDVVVVGNRPDAQRLAIELGVDLLVVSNGDRPAAGDRSTLAEQHGTAVVVSPARQLRLGPHDHAGRAVQGAHGRQAAHGPPRRPARRRRRDGQGRALPRRRRDRPAGLPGRPRDALGPRAPDAAAGDPRRPRRAGAERRRASRRPRSSRSSTTTTSARSRRACPVRATFDPVGSTATLVVERFRQNGMEPSRPAATVLLGAVLSDTVILNSPTTTERDRAVVEYLERYLGVRGRGVRPRDVRGGLGGLRGVGRRDRQPRRQGVRGRLDDDLASRRSRSSAPRWTSAPTSCSAR